MAASTTGTGELIDLALDAGAKKIIVCLGGSATTDGGLGAVRAIHAPHRLRGVELLVACDVRTTLRRRRRGVRPAEGRHAGAGQAAHRPARARSPRSTSRSTASTCATIDGTGAAGGIAGALAALGGQLVPGFELVADELDLYDAIAAADLVITGEGYLDEQSFEGKVVGGVQALAGRGTATGRGGRRRRRTRGRRLASTTSAWSTPSAWSRR